EKFLVPFENSISAHTWRRYTMQTNFSFPVARSGTAETPLFLCYPVETERWENLKTTDLRRFKVRGSNYEVRTFSLLPLNSNLGPLASTALPPVMRESLIGLR